MNPVHLKLWPLVLANLACMIALMAFVALIGPMVRILGLAEWHAGATVTVAGALWFLTARGWGVLSDRHGRKPMLAVALGGFAAAYLLLAVSLQHALNTIPHWLVAFAILLAGRGAMGMFYAAIPTTANAMIADHLPPQTRARAMASLGAAGAVGLVVGPAAAGLLAFHSLALPLFVTAALPFVAWFLLMWQLPSTPPRAERGRPVPRLMDPRLRLPLAVAFMATFSVSIAQITVGFFALDQLGLEPEAGARAAGYALASVGLTLILSQLLVRYLRWSPLRLIATGAAIGAAGFVYSATAGSTWQLMLGYAIAAFGMGWVFPAMSAAAANAVEAHEQGATAGTLSSAQGLGVVVGPLIGTLLYGWSPGAPYLLIGALLLCTAAAVTRSALRALPATGG